VDSSENMMNMMVPLFLVASAKRQQAPRQVHDIASLEIDVLSREAVTDAKYTRCWFWTKTKNWEIVSHPNRREMQDRL
jgi:hypothetical protein